MPLHLLIRYLFALTLLLTLVARASAIGTTPPSWQPREFVEIGLPYFDGHQGADRTLAYDHHGNPAIAFLATQTNGYLRYARRVPGVGWVHAVVDPISTRFPSLAFDRYERPAISYLQYSSSDLRYAHFDGAAWQIETVDSTGDVGLYTSLAFDRMGRPAIAYHDATNTSLKYVADTDGDLSLADETPVTVVNEFSEGYYASLVFDVLNRPMIAHTATGSSIDSIGALRFSVKEPGIGWVTTTVENLNLGGIIAEDPSIAIDPDTGFPAIAYADSNGWTLRYAAWDGDDWIVNTVGPARNGEAFPSLAFDPADGNPAICYYDIDFSYRNSDLRLVWHDGSSWQTQTVNVVDYVGFTPSLAFNNYGTGFPSVAYFAGGLPSVLYFIEDPPAVPEPSALAALAIGVVATLMRPRKTCV